ncbi:tyrosine--tRNA ligase [Candidatus Mycoplasma haematominutum]|uniref:tyrosine--tRNA ligase n=1 Tax=Candidatus Mycoplasma haematominutum TaxID=209446 RepID=UPI0005C5EAD9|nr:tyrosine--tRNA ligase [Candidatus Mycoplasma haematominutum]
MDKGDFFKELKNRNLIYDSTPEGELRKILNANGGIYIGFDLTAPSLHWGHFLLLQILNRASEYQIKTVIILGDFTTQIGDASLRKEDRNRLDISEQNKNLQLIKVQLSKFSPNSKILLNSTFYNNFSISFLSETLNFFKLSQLLSKDFLKCRLKNQTLTLKDIFYPVLQSYDFYQLFLKEGIQIQMGGQDQWGNITTGMEFIRKNKNLALTGGFTVPLLTDSKGQKFGKSGKNTLFLCENLTPPYKCFQYFWNLSDEKIKELSCFIFDNSAKLDKCDSPKTLKERVIKYFFSQIYSSLRFSKIQKISQLLFSNSNLNSDQLQLIGEEIPFYSASEFPNLSEILIKLGLSFSHSESKRLVEHEKCIYCFDYQCKNHKEKLDKNIGKDSYFLIQKGEKEFGLFKLIN